MAGTFGGLTATSVTTGAFATLFDATSTGLHAVAGYKVRNTDPVNTLQVKVTMSNGDVWQDLISPNDKEYYRGGAAGIVKVEAKANTASINAVHCPSADLSLQS